MKKIKNYVKELRDLIKLRRTDIEIKRNGMNWRQSSIFSDEVFWSHSTEEDPMFPVIYSTLKELSKARKLKLTWFDNFLLRFF